MSTQCCRTCRYLRVPLRKDGKRNVNSLSAYPCDAPKPQFPPVSHAISKGYDWERLIELTKMQWYVSPDEGTKCPVWAALEKAEATP